MRFRLFLLWIAFSTLVIGAGQPVFLAPAVAKETVGSVDRDKEDDQKTDREDDRDDVEQAEKDAEKASEDARDDAEKAEQDAAKASEDARDDAEKAEQDDAKAGEDARDDAEKAEQDAAKAGEDARDDAEKAGEDAKGSADNTDGPAEHHGNGTEQDAVTSTTVASEIESDADSGGEAANAAQKAEVAGAMNDGARSTPAGSAEPMAASMDTDKSAQTEDAGIEYDREGYAHAGREILALISAGDDASIVQELGLSIKSRENLSGLGLELLRISIADGIAADDAIARLSIDASNATFAVNHFYAAGRLGGRVTAVAKPHKRAPTNIVVGMIDGGVANGVLAPEVQIERRGYASNGGGSDHGTAVASILAQSGVSKIVVADIFSGSSAQADSIVRALDWMAKLEIGVINMSFTGPPNPVIARMIALMEKRGHAIVAAIGNDGPAAPPLYPAAYAGVVAVTAVDRQGKVYRRANRGAWTSFAAEGVDVTTTDASGTDRIVSGTSFAAPIVSALLARDLPAPNPEARRRAIERLIASARDLGTSGRDPVYGYGLVGMDP